MHKPLLWCASMRSMARTHRSWQRQKAPYYALEVVEQGRQVHIHPDGTRHVHHEATDVRGIYVTHVTFPQPGAWGLEVLAKQGKGPVASSRFSVTVLATSRTPALGYASTPEP